MIPALMRMSHFRSANMFVPVVQAVELKPDFRSALFNLALLLSDSGRPLEAAPFLHHLVHHHPDHIKAFILLGDIYVNNMKDLDEAERVCTDFTEFLAMWWKP